MFNVEWVNSLIVIWEFISFLPRLPLLLPKQIIINELVFSRPPVGPHLRPHLKPHAGACVSSQKIIDGEIL